MGDHTTLVEDMRIAAKKLGETNAVGLSLRRAADELKDYDHFFCKDYHSPFLGQDVWVLEYNPNEGHFHWNSSYDDKTGVFRQGLFTNGWFPGCVLPDCYSTDGDLIELLESLGKEKAPYVTAVRRVFEFFAKRRNI